jgi:hypothetical protein
MNWLNYAEAIVMNSLFFKKNIFYRKRHEQLCYAVLLSFSAG